MQVLGEKTKALIDGGEGEEGRGGSDLFLSQFQSPTQQIEEKKGRIGQATMAIGKRSPAREHRKTERDPRKGRASFFFFKVAFDFIILFLPRTWPRPIILSKKKRRAWKNNATVR